MFKRLSMYIFIVLIFAVPVASFLEPDSERSELLNSSLQQTPEINSESTANSIISEAQQYVEDQFVKHESIFKIKNIWDYILRIDSSPKFYYIPELNMSYKYDHQVITEPSYIKGFDDVCENNQETNFLYYVVPSKRDYIPDEYMKYDYNQNTNAYRQDMIKQDLSMYNCIDTSYNPDLLKVTDFYNFDHHYNSKGVFKIYNDLLNTYNELYNYNFKPIEAKDLKEVEVSSQFYINDLIAGIIPNYTMEKMPKNASVDEGNPYEVIDYKRKGLYENPNAEDGKILLVTDSFGQAMLPYITENFASIESVDFYYFAANPEELEEKFVLSDYDTVIIYTFDYNVYQNQDYAVSK